MLDENNFLIISDRFLTNLMNKLDDSLGDYVDVEFASGVLTIEFDNEESYVITRHAPKRQIWVSSPISGGSHYNYDDALGGWISDRGKILRLLDFLAKELGQITNTQVLF
jgi:frataxin